MKTVQKVGLLAVLGFTLAGGGQGLSAQAHEEATGIVKERMELMKSLGGRMKAMAGMVKGEKPFDPDTIATMAAEIAERAPKIAPMFPKGSMQMPTEALPAIWEDWTRFESLTMDLGSEAMKLAEAAKGGEKADIIGQFGKLGKSCGTCHTDFRKKKEEKK